MRNVPVGSSGGGAKDGPAHESYGVESRGEAAPSVAPPAPTFDESAPTTSAPELDSDGEGFGDAARADAASGASKSAPRAGSSQPFEREKRPEHRPGLATQFGEQRFSRVTSAPFSRAEPLSPFALGKVFYNDPQGIDAMASGLGPRQHRVSFPVASGHVDVGLRDGRGRFLSGFTAGGDNFVSGIKCERYTIVVRNHSPGRVEAVVSVDGLDVIDGRPAALKKRGYLLEAHDEVEIDGFRTSSDEVAAFRFGSVASSYAAKKHGETRNVGVIGVALFHESGDHPSRWPSPFDGREVDRRHGADPFPSRFSSPP